MGLERITVIFHLSINTKTSFIQIDPNIVNVGWKMKIIGTCGNINERLESTESFTFVRTVN